MKEVTSRAFDLSNLRLIEARVIPFQKNTSKTDDGGDKGVLKLKICFNLAEGSMIIPIVDILRLESASNYTIVYTKESKKIIVSKTMKMVEKLLPANQFIRCHNSHVVNVDEVISFKKGSLMLSSSIEIPIARQKFQDVVQFIQSNCITL